MINLRATTSNKLFISRDGLTANEECKAWGLEVYDNTVKISSLITGESVYEDHYSDFQANGVPFTTLQACVDYITPCLGFNTAPGGSGANDEYTETIQLSDGQLATIGSIPVVVSTLFTNQKSAGQHYNIKEIIWKGTAGGSPYSAERMYFYGCFNAILPTNSLPSYDDSIAIVRTQSTLIFDDGGSLYLESPLTVVGQELSVTTYSGNNPSVAGNGTVEIIVTYTILDF